MVRGWCIAASVAGALQASSAVAVELDQKAVVYKLPAEIQWKESPSGARSAILHGDPSQPGIYVVLVEWTPNHMSRPHWHPNDRFIPVLSGTWWVGSGTTFDPERTVPMPAGSFVTHFGKQVHYDGAKGEKAVLQIVGQGP